ncbi:acyloxyacyl hydrolase [Hellea sp.]|nr:acyloxyacyl hydrolase [Hellea sp.]
MLDYGSRVLIREQLTLGYGLNEDWTVEGYCEHVSPGNLWTNADNDGSDSAGFRVNRTF